MAVDAALVDRARAVADAVLYEGYVLYPYRASAAKNRLRWQFGVLVPPAHVGHAGEPSTQRTECIVEGDSGHLQAIIRFLHLESRTDPQGGGTWEEGIERQVTVEAELSGLLTGARETGFAFAGDVAAGGHRSSRTVEGRARLQAARAGCGRPAVRLRLLVENTSTWPSPTGDRDEALRRSLVGVHTLLALDGATFVSTIDPPAWAEAVVGACRNAHAFPVLIGEEGDRRAVLSSPIILYDHPQVAPESPGALYDATEIDEVLTLRTLALTEEEKREARATDPRAAAVIDRVESMDATTLGRLHGTWRDLRSGDGQPTPHRTGLEPPVAPGTRVRLRPRRRADAQDMFLDGRVGVIRRVEVDAGGGEILAVTVEDDPAAELNEWYGRHHYFHRDEIEPLEGRA